MPNTKLFLVQFLIEADVSEWPDFDEAQAAEHFLKTLNLSEGDKKLGAQAYLLARKPGDRDDLLIESYEDRGYNVEIEQSAETVGTDAPRYFAFVYNPRVKNPTSNLGQDHPTVEAAKEEARTRVDKRLARLGRQKSKREGAQDS